MNETYIVFCFLFFFFNYTATTDIYPLSLHDALPIWHAAPSSILLRPGPSHRPPRKGTTTHRHRWGLCTSRVSHSCVLFLPPTLPRCPARFLLFCHEAVVGEVQGGAARVPLRIEAHPTNSP